MSNCSNIPVEALDQKYGFFRVVEYSLRSDSGGDGAFRGGRGLCRKYEILADDISLAHYSDRYRQTSDGIFGGKPGASARGKVVRAAGGITIMGSKASLNLHKGDILVCETGGGGGYGDPLG
jgi:N-methylhydantoinase B